MNEEPDVAKNTNEAPKFFVRNASDIQRLRVEKLMKNPDKPIIIPERSREKDFNNTIPNFVRNVMGSSAGAGSGEFHVYRHLRRKEYARQKYIQQKSFREQLDDQYQLKIEQNRLNAEEKTAKKRQKRLKLKEKVRNRSKLPNTTETQNTTPTIVTASSSSNSEGSDNESKKTDEPKTQPGAGTYDFSEVQAQRVEEHATAVKVQGEKPIEQAIQETHQPQPESKSNTT